VREKERETIEDGEICSSRRNAVASDLSLLLLLALDCIFQTPILLVLPSTGVLHKRRFGLWYHQLEFLHKEDRMEHRDHRSRKIQHLELKKSVHLMVEKDLWWSSCQ